MGRLDEAMEQLKPITNRCRVPDFEAPHDFHAALIAEIANLRIKSKRIHDIVIKIIGDNIHGGMQCADAMRAIHTEMEEFGHDLDL